VFIKLSLYLHPCLLQWKVEVDLIEVLQPGPDLGDRADVSGNNVGTNICDLKSFIQPFHPASLKLRTSKS